MNALNVLDLADAYAAVALTEAAVELGILDRLERGPATATELASELHLDPGSTARLLNTLTAFDLVREEGPGRFAPGPASWLPARMGIFDGLAERVRSGAPPAPFETAAGADRQYPKIVAVMAELFGSAAEHAADCLEGTGPAILDVGGGASPWSLALARRDAGRRVTVLDRPSVLQTTRGAVEAAGLGDAYRYLDGDMTRDALPGDAFDLAIAANVCHLFGADVNRRLLDQLSSTLHVGGTVAIIDQMPDRPHASAPALLHDVTLFARTTHGEVHAFSTYCTWLREAGFTRLEHTALTAPRPLGLLTAVKAA